jgi:serine/threonine protein kinase
MSPRSGRNSPDRAGLGSQYELLVKVASGGMATIYVGRRIGGDGRLWAIKRAHAHLLERKESKRMFIDEARVASRIRHPNIVSVEDIEDLPGELRLIMEYVEGGTLTDLIGRDEPLSPALAVRIALDASAGLHAAHGITGDDGQPLGLVHRDVSPHNILIGIDGVARLSDFGVAKNAHSSMSTTTGALKGKLAYMSPEYIEGAKADARHDVFALGVVVWEMLANKRLFRGANEVETMKLVTAAEVPPLSRVAPHVGTEFDAALAMALARRPDDRFENAQAFGAALEVVAERAGLSATHADVGRHLEDVLRDKLRERREVLAHRLVPSGAASSPTSSTAKMGGAAIPGSGGTLPLLSPGQTLAVDSQAPTHRVGSAPTGRQDSVPVNTIRSREPTTPPDMRPTPEIAIIDATTAVESSIPEPAGVPRPSRMLKWVLTAMVGLTVGGGLTFLVFGEDPGGASPSASEPDGENASAETGTTVEPGAKAGAEGTAAGMPPGAAVSSSTVEPGPLGAPASGSAVSGSAASGSAVSGSAASGSASSNPVAPPPSKGPGALGIGPKPTGGGAAPVGSEDEPAGAAGGEKPTIKPNPYH